MSQPIVKVFSATLARERDRLGEVCTEWMRAHPDVQIEEIRTLLSSDSEFHCLTLVVIGRTA